VCVFYLGSLQQRDALQVGRVSVSALRCAFGHIYALAQTFLMSRYVLQIFETSFFFSQAVAQAKQRGRVVSHTHTHTTRAIVYARPDRLSDRQTLSTPQGDVWCVGLYRSPLAADTIHLYTHSARTHTHTYRQADRQTERCVPPCVSLRVCTYQESTLSLSILHLLLKHFCGGLQSLSLLQSASGAVVVVFLASAHTYTGVCGVSTCARRHE